MSVAAHKQEATYEDLRRAPAGRTAELIDGELFLQPRPRAAHARVQVSIASHLDVRFGRPGGGWIFMAEPELHLGRHVLVPDLAAWTTQRMPSVPDVVGVPLEPDWICEVLSPSTERVDRLQKMSIYAEHGVRHAWLVTPSQHLVECYERHDKTWIRAQVVAGPDKAAVAPFAGLELDLASVFFGIEQIPQDG